MAVGTVSGPVLRTYPAQPFRPGASRADVRGADTVQLSPTAHQTLSNHPDRNRPADFTDRLGSLDYYKDRAADFRRRNPGLEPPDYYMEYGDKYARRFTHELAPTLTPQGQTWLRDARRNLQERIEARRQQDPAAFAQLERNPEAFRRFAYDTHPGAYQDAGLANLPMSDLVKIPLTPDLKDLLSLDGLRQVAQTGGGVAGTWASQGANWVGRQASEATDWAADSAVGRWIGRRFQ